MADKEKLIEICRRYDGTPPCDTCKTPIGNCNMCGLERLVDYLISHGVTVRERGRWIQDTPFACVCSVCNHERYGLANDSGDNFCHNCGADMRPEGEGEEDA